MACYHLSRRDRDNGLKECDSCYVATLEMERNVALAQLTNQKQNADDWARVSGRYARERDELLELGPLIDEVIRRVPGHIHAVQALRAAVQKFKVRYDIRMGERWHTQPLPDTNKIGG